MDAPTLTHTNRARLRKIVKRTHMRFYPAEKLTDREADAVIDTFAPDVAERLIKAFVDGHLEGVREIEQAVAIAGAVRL